MEKPQAFLACIGCDYWQHPADGGEYGQCHGRTPLVVLNQGDLMLTATFPGTKALDWCAANPKESMRLMALQMEQNIKQAGNSSKSMMAELSGLATMLAAPHDGSAPQ